MTTIAKDKIAVTSNNGFQYETETHSYWDPFIRRLPDHGWKIHISCNHSNYKNILKIVSNYCFQNSYSFKFVNDINILKYLLSKNADRTEAGKFITIYPFGNVEFMEIVRTLYRKLEEFTGPYILSDKRYLDSKVIYYRYGVISSNSDIMTFPEGDVIDERVPYYNHPKFVEDPLFENNEQFAESKKSILMTRYKNIEAIHFSNSGGVYKALNIETQQEVILKEARPYIGISEQNSSISCRKREAAFLRIIENEKLTPKYNFDFFEWEHYFLEVEKIKGVPLRKFIEENTLVLIKEDNTEEIAKRLRNFSEFTKNLLKAIIKLQSYGIIINDISENNILLDSDLQPIFIDLEDAYFDIENGPEKFEITNTNLEDDRKEELPELKKDIHKFGYLLMSILSNSNFLLQKDSTGEMSINSFTYFCSVYNIEANILDTVRMMISGDYEEIVDILEVLMNQTRPFKMYIRNFNTFDISKYSRTNNRLIDIDNLGLALLIYNEDIISEKIMNLDLFRMNEYIDNNNLIGLSNFISNRKLKGSSLNGGMLEEIYIYIYLYSKTSEQKYIPLIKEKLVRFGKDYLGDLCLIREGINSIPYISHTAGFAKALIVYLTFEYDVELQGMLVEILDSIDRNFPKQFGYYNGLAGIADTLLDAYKLTKQEKYFNSVKQKAEILMSFPFERDSSFSRGKEGVNYFYYKLANYLKEKKQ